MSPYSEYYQDVKVKFEKLKNHLNEDQQMKICFKWSMQSVSGLDLYKKYAHADVLMIPSLCDGLNLVAKEYMYIRQMINQPQVLLCSETVGVTAEIKSTLYTYNPYSSESFEEQFHQTESLFNNKVLPSNTNVNHDLADQDVKKWALNILTSELD